MTREEFIEVLAGEGYSYEIEGDKIIVTNEGTVYLTALTSIPPGVEFKNGGNAWLGSLTSLPPVVEFKNEGDVDLGSLTSLPPGVEFNNGGEVYLTALTSIPPDVVFNDGGEVDLSSLVGGWFEDWSGNIEGIRSNRLLNVMIKRGMFI